MSKPVPVTRLDRSAFDLRREASRCNDGAVVRRLLAIALVLEGRPRTEAAEACGMDRQTLRDWVHHYNEEGLDGLANRRSPGRPAQLTPEQLAAFKALVSKVPIWRGTALSVGDAAICRRACSRTSLCTIMNAASASCWPGWRSAS